MVARSLSILRFPLVALAFVVDRLRRVPGAAFVERRAPWVVSALVVAALVALSVWAAQRSPQRVSMSELVQGRLAPMQTWIIVTGELSARPVSTRDYRYTLTDPAMPGAEIFVVSETELQVGHATVSGRRVGGSSRAQAGFGWVGQMRADPVLVPEPDPPWIAIALAAAAVFVAAGGRTLYPMFFSEKPHLTEPTPVTLSVGVRRGWPPPDRPVVPGTVVVRPGTPVELRVPSETRQLLLHSAHSSVEVGEFRRLFDSEPALVVRPAATEELTLGFASTDQRDAAFSALVADVDRRGHDGGGRAQ